MMACAAPGGTPPWRFNYLLITKKQVIAPLCRTKALRLMSPPEIPFFYFHTSGVNASSCAFQYHSLPRYGVCPAAVPKSRFAGELSKTIHLNGGQGVHPLGSFPLHGSEGVTLKMVK